MRVRLCVLLVLLLAVGLSAQTSTSIGSLGAVARLDVTGMATASITVSGTYSGTVSFEVIGGAGTPAVAVECVAPDDLATGVSSTTGTGVWMCPVAGLSVLQARMSAYTSGAALIDMIAARWF